ncbi:MAG: hypothetical protein WCX88_04630 [Patescibacteria group bacterium]
MTQTQIQIDIKSWIIVFKDRSKKYITENQANALIIQSGNSAARGIMIDGGFIDFATIGKVLPVSEFYEQYPDERPGREVQPFNADVFLKNYKTPLRERALNKLATGLKKYISGGEYKGGNGPLIILDKVENALKVIV